MAELGPDGFNCSILGSGLCYVFQFVYCFRLKEPESETEPEKISLSALFSPVHLVNSFKTVFKQRENRGRPILLLTLISLFIVQTTVCGESDILYIFMANIQISDYFQYYFAFKSAMGALALLLGFPVLKRSGVFILQNCQLFLRFLRFFLLQCFPRRRPGDLCPGPSLLPGRDGEPRPEQQPHHGLHLRPPRLRYQTGGQPPQIPHLSERRPG